MVELKKWDRSYAEKLAELLNDRSILDNLRDGLPFPYRERDALFYIESCLNADENEQFCYAIFADGQLVGSIGVFRQGNIHFRTAELGYYIGKNFWGRGYATAAVTKLCEQIFENTDIVRIYAEPFADNVASCRVLEKSGFACEGVLKSNAYKNGVIKDMKMYSLIKK